MNVSQFRQQLAEAVEARESLATARMASLAAEAGDIAFWQSQVRLDRAIGAWKDQRRPRLAGRPLAGRLCASIAALAAGFGAAWVSRPVETMLPNVATVPTMAVATLEPPTAEGFESIRPEPLVPVVAPIPRNENRLAAATVTAERLAYAFQPVGEQVSSVVRLLIDSVPGADVFAL
jgi:hypothetical protein